MPSAYRHNFTTGEIRYARRRVGSVRRDGDAGLYTATIFVSGRDEPVRFVARDAGTAFREAAARAMGHASLAHLRAANAGVRARNRVRRQQNLSELRSAMLRGSRPNPMAEAELIASLQRGAIECGDTPLTEQEIRATWLRS